VRSQHPGLGIDHAVAFASAINRRPNFWRAALAPDVTTALTREEMIEAGIITPRSTSGELVLRPLRLPDGTAVLRLDAAGRAAAERDIYRGDHGKREVEMGKNRIPPPLLARPRGRAA
jgi:hypothetical protein